MKIEYVDLGPDPYYEWGEVSSGLNAYFDPYMKLAVRHCIAYEHHVGASYPLGTPEYDTITRIIKGKYKEIEKLYLNQGSNI